MVADDLHWILVIYFGNSNLFHYLDDFFSAGKANTLECTLTLNDILCLCDAVQAPLKPETVIGPSTQMIILGIGVGYRPYAGTASTGQITVTVGGTGALCLIASH